MKDFKHWGIKIRNYPEFNYKAVWFNLKTIRLGSGEVKQLPPDKSEFYDVSLGTTCNLECKFCYAGAKKSGRNFSNVCEKAKMFFGSMDENSRATQIAIGSGGEGTIHPDFIEFIKTIYDLNIVPNYTTNGITIAEDNEYSKKLLEATEKYCGGVAVSANSFSENIDRIWRKAVEKLSKIDVYINLHIIISDKNSVDRFYDIYKEYEEIIHTFVLLPIMPEGRSNQSCNKETFRYFVDKWDDITDKSKVAFGANFYPYLKEQEEIKCYLYEPESFSKNLILDDNIVITPSSFNTKEILWRKKYQ